MTKETQQLSDAKASYGAFDSAISKTKTYGNGGVGASHGTRGESPELTIKAMCLGCVLSIVLGAANAYLGLKVGMTVSASIPASVMSMAVLSVFESHTVLENNQVQTCAASGPSVTAGAIFTIPALLMSGYWTSFPYFYTLGVILVGGTLGILFTIPLRKALVVGSDLRFPEGVATAAVLEAGAKAGDKVMDMYTLGLSSAYGAFSKVMGQGLGLWMEDGCQNAWYIRNSVFYVGTDLSVALVGVGYIVGLNICCLCFVGGLINWWVAIPLEMLWNQSAYESLATTQTATDLAGEIWSTKTRYLGVGAMTVGGLWTLVTLRNELSEGVKAAMRGMSGSSGGEEHVSQRESDLPWHLVLPLMIVSTIGFFCAAFAVTTWGAALIAGSAMFVGAFLFSAVAAYMAGLVGSSNNPISGITISSILVCSLLLYALLGGSQAAEGATAAIVIGSMVCCAAAIGGDNMQDLKCGHIVGATPWKQQLSQMIGVLSGALVIPVVLELLRQAYGFEGASDGHRHPLPAPQAGLMHAVAQGVFEQSLPWWWVGIGAALAVGCIMLDELLRLRESQWRCPVLAVAVGVYLPWCLTVPMLLGGIITEMSSRFHRDTESHEKATHQGILASSGLITGEALAGVALAIPVAWAGREDVLYVLSEPGPAWVGLLVLLVAVAGLTSVVLRSQPPAEETAA